MTQARKSEHATYALLGVFAAGIVIAFVLFQGHYLIAALALGGIYTIAIVGLVLLTGLSGQYSLGHASFFGIGAYASALVVGAGWPPLAACLAAIVVATSLAVLIGIPLLRLRGYYLAVATLAFGLIVFSLLNGWRSLTLGPSGMGNIAPFSIAGVTFADDTADYWLAWGVAFFSVWAGANLWRSRMGQAMLAVKRDEQAAAALGINVAATKLKIFALSAAFAGLAGSLYAHHVHFISPERFSMIPSFELLLAALLGGIGTPFGAILGALLLIALPDIVVSLRDYKVIAYGVVFILVSLYFPRGIAGMIQDLLAWARRARRSPGPDASAVTAP